MNWSFEQWFDTEINFLIFWELSVKVQVFDTTFSSIPWNTLFQLALQGPAAAAHLLQANFNFQFFSAIILLFAQQKKYFSVLKPFQVCCCATSGAEQAWKITVSLQIIHWSLQPQKFSQNPVEGIFSSAVTQWIKIVDFAPELLSPLSQLFPNLGTIKRGKSYRTTCLEFFF